MAVTLTVILTYLIIKYTPYFKRLDQYNNQVKIVLPAEKTLLVKQSDEDSHSVKNKTNPIAKDTVSATENAFKVKLSKAGVSQGSIGNKTKPIVKGNVSPADNLSIIRPSDSDFSIGSYRNRKWKLVASDATKKLSVWRFLKRRRFFKRNTLRKSILNLILKNRNRH